ncbi:MAG TPA: apolipoprotein N-acyltransferase [Thermoanaerobaculia bacterium]|nr:apolipoprotein N-acyltransferase [Thermoanaerobaculia bacterium]
MKRFLSWTLLAAGGGLVWALCFARQPLSFASWLALAPLLLLLRSPWPGRLAFLHGFVAWMVSLNWIVPTLETYGGGIPKPLGFALTGLLAAYLSLFGAVFARLGAPVWRRGGLARLFVLPALWVALEWLRTLLFGGFPWNLAAYAWVEVPGALPLSAWIGAYGISFLLLLANAAVAAAVERGEGDPWQRRWRPLVVGLGLPLLLLPLAGRWNVRQLDAEVHNGVNIGAPFRLLQPNIPNLVEYDAVQVLANYRKVVDLSLASCQPGSLVVWPESAAWPLQYGRDPDFQMDLRDMVARGCTVLFNSNHPAGNAFYNSAFLLAPGEAPALRYDKRHLVPFGEFIPFKGLFSWMDKLARNAGDFLPAESLTLLPWGGEKIGMAICYEVVYPAEVAELTRAGATILVTITNDAWYGDTTAPWQHFRAARFRAAENRRPMLRAAITGVSALIRSDGSVQSQLGVFQEGVIRGWIVGLSGLTPYVRCPWLVPLLCTVVAAFGVYFSRRGQALLPRRRGHGESDSAQRSYPTSLPPA